MEGFSQSKLNKRSQNGSDVEEVLITESLKRSNILNGKLSNTITNSDKNKAWDSITDAVNAVGGGRDRNKVKKKWANMSARAVQKVRDFTKHSQKTGGGPPCKVPDELEYKIVQDISAAKLIGVRNGIDTSSQLLDEAHENNEATVSTEDFPTVNWSPVATTDETVNDSPITALQHSHTKASSTATQAMARLQEYKIGDKGSKVKKRSVDELRYVVMESDLKRIRLQCDMIEKETIKLQREEEVLSLQKEKLQFEIAVLKLTDPKYPARF